MLKYFSLAVASALCAVFFFQAASAGASSAPARRVSADPCNITQIAAAMRKSPSAFSPAEQRRLVAWCKSQQQKDAAAKPARVGATDLKARPAAKATGPGTIRAPGDGTGIWCGKKTCVCWKGNLYNGCVHTDKLCAKQLNCIGKICGCEAKD